MFVLDLLYTLFAFVIILSLLVFVHELGHYLGCVWLNVRVSSFSIGMGKEIFGWTNKRKERWKISMLPIGGYVMMYGDADASSGKADKNLLENATEEDKKTIIYFQPAWKKFIITFLGPFFSLLFGVILLTFMYNVKGISVMEPIVADVLPDSPSFGILRKDDVILEIDDKKISYFSEVVQTVALSNGEVLRFKILRDGEVIDEDIVPSINEAKDMFGNSVEVPFIGVVSRVESVKRLNIFQSFMHGVKATFTISKNTLLVLKQMVLRERGTDDLGGPIKIAKYSSQSFRNGFWTTIYFIAMLTINLGLMNLLPIPVLDGGALLFLLLEMIFRKEIPENIQDKLLRVGFGILIFIMLFATFNDVKSFF
ncbi:MAG: RIP metalloprotease RseP [Rickettsiales bacterium]|jgi:regulator of sigma E protease|nr:RIP metalloprotease RseP [Rickettsiales bacterium]